MLKTPHLHSVAPQSSAKAKTQLEANQNAYAKTHGLPVNTNTTPLLTISFKSDGIEIIRRIGVVHLLLHRQQDDYTAGCQEDLNILVRSQRCNPSEPPEDISANRQSRHTRGRFEKPRCVSLLPIPMPHFC